MRHQRDREGHRGQGQSLTGTSLRPEGWGGSPLCRLGLGRAAVPEQPQSIAEPLPQIRGAAQLPKVGSKVSTSAAVSGHESHKEGLPATEDQLGVVSVEVHLCTGGWHGSGPGPKSFPPHHPRPPDLPQSQRSSYLDRAITKQHE